MPLLWLSAPGSGEVVLATATVVPAAGGVCKGFCSNAWPPYAAATVGGTSLPLPVVAGAAPRNVPHVLLPEPPTTPAPGMAKAFCSTKTFPMVCDMSIQSCHRHAHDGSKHCLVLRISQSDVSTQKVLSCISVGVCFRTCLLCLQKHNH